MEEAFIGSLITYKWIAKQFAFKIIKDPTISYRSIQEQTKKKFLINVSISQCKRAKQRALFDHEGGLIDHYSRLWDYRQQILDTNPGKLLTAMGRDGNNQMFPIAWALVNIENTNNWQWFMAYLCKDLMLHQGAYLTIISDGHKGLMEVVHTMLPYAKHRQCARHIYANFKKKWNGLHYKFLLRGVVGNINPNSWCKAFFKMDKGCRAYENGISESYHNSIRIARVGSSAIWPNTREGPYFPPVKRKMPSRPRKLKIKHKACKNEPQPKPTKEKKKPGRKNNGSSLVYPSHEAGDAGPSIVGGSAADVDESGPIGVDESGIETSRTSMKEVVEASIAAGTLKLAGSSANKDWDVDTMKDVVFEVYVVKHWLIISPNVEVSFFKLLRTTDDIEDITFDVFALPCYGLVLFIMALFIHAL
ncbi:peptidyl-prolyl cis-trans isomerase CYP37, chloroplastic [Tanacetum coccineum]